MNVSLPKNHDFFVFAWFFMINFDFYSTCCFLLAFESVIVEDRQKCGVGAIGVGAIFVVEPSTPLLAAS